MTCGLPEASSPFGPPRQAKAGGPLPETPRLPAKEPLLGALASEAADCLAAGSLVLEGYAAEGMRDGAAAYSRVYLPLDFDGGG